MKIISWKNSLACFILMLPLLAFDAFGTELTEEPHAAFDSLTIYVTIKDIDNAFGGGITIVYDDAMSLIEAKAGEGLAGMATFVNPNFDRGKARLSWASLDPVAPNSRLMELSFSLNGQNPGKVAIEAIRLVDQDGNSIEADMSSVQLTTTVEKSGTSSAKNKKSSADAGGIREDAKIDSGDKNYSPNFWLNCIVFKQIWEIVLYNTYTFI